MMFHSESLSVERIVHWADKLRRFSAGGPLLDYAAEDWKLPLPNSWA